MSEIEKALERIGDSWRFPTWDKEDPESWRMLQAGVTVGEVYLTTGAYIKWHCKTSDWRDTHAITMEQAAAECEASFWKEEWHRLRDAVRAGK